MKSTRYVLHHHNQWGTYPVNVLRNGIRISSQVWWVFVRLCGIDAIDQMMMEPEFD